MAWSWHYRLPTKMTVGKARGGAAGGPTESETERRDDAGAAVEASGLRH